MIGAILKNVKPPVLFTQAGSVCHELLPANLINRAEAGIDGFDHLVFPDDAGVVMGNRHSLMEGCDAAQIMSHHLAVPRIKGCLVLLQQNPARRLVRRLINIGFVQHKLRPTIGVLGNPHHVAPVPGKSRFDFLDERLP